MNPRFLIFSVVSIALQAWLIWRKNRTYHEKQSTFEIIDGRERETIEKKTKRLKSLVKSQQKVRAKRKQVLKELYIDHLEVATKLKKPEEETTAGRPNLESQQEGLLGGYPFNRHTWIFC